MEKEKSTTKNHLSGTNNNRDTKKYRYKNKEYSQHTDLIKDVFRDYAKMKDSTVEVLAKEWKLTEGEHYITRDEFDRRKRNGELKNDWFFDRKDPELNTISLRDGKIVISSNWPLMVNSVPKQFAQFLKQAEKLGIEILVISE